jgi:hypothetical protein
MECKEIPREDRKSTQRLGAPARLMPGHPGRSLLWRVDALRGLENATTSKPMTKKAVGNAVSNP